MTLQDLGYLGSLIGGIGIVLTLLYLAIELRNNTRAIRAQTYHALTQNSINIVSNFFAGDDFLDFFMRVAPSRKPLSKKESVRWQGFMLAVFRHWDNLLYQKEANALDQQQWQGYLNVFEFWVQYPRFADWFAANKRFFSKDLAQLMDKIIAASPPPRRATRRSNKAV